LIVSVVSFIKMLNYKVYPCIRFGDVILSGLLTHNQLFLIKTLHLTEVCKYSIIYIPPIDIFVIIIKSITH